MRSKRNPSSPWNPAVPAEVTPAEYEREVVAWLRASGGELMNFEVQHLRDLPGDGGEYEFDAVAEFNILRGAFIRVLVECKRYKRPVEREKLLALWAKLQDVGAHKAMMFATCGFQSGALDYAPSKGIATVAFVGASFLYETKSVGGSTEPPPWLDLPCFAGIFMAKAEKKISSSTITRKRTDELGKWLEE